MALQIEEKKKVVSEVSQVAAEAYSAIAAEYRGMPVADVTGLRARAREQGVYVRVVKNTLARRALQGTAYECMSQDLVGPLMLFFSQHDPGSAARLVKEFSEDSELLEVKMIAVDGQLLEASELERLSSLPNKEQAISMLMAVMRAPIEKLVRTLAAPHTILVRTITAVRDCKQAGGQQE